MFRILRPYTGRTVVVDVEGAPVRGVLHAVSKGAIIVSHVETEDGESVDGLLIIPLPVLVQVV